MMAAAFDEMNGSGGELRPAYRRLSRWLKETPPENMDTWRRAAEFARRLGGSFTACVETEVEKNPTALDVIPRILSAKEWMVLERGLQQRLRALNMFLRDIYHGREILRAKTIPEDLIFRNPLFRPEMNAQAVPHDVYIHIAGIDIVRTSPGGFFALNDSVRGPSGISRMLENRETMMRLFPELFSLHNIVPLERYPDEVLSMLRAVAPHSAPAEPAVVLLTQGADTSTYSECSFFADRLGIELVEGRDLIVRGDVVFMRTTEGLKRVDVIYHGIEDDLLDPLTFRPESSVGVPGLMAAFAAGNITLANAPGAGIAEDKAIYSYVPEIVKFYLGEEPILKNVPTWRCREAKDLAYVLDHLSELVVKEVRDGGFGMLIGPIATKATIDAFREKLKQEPERFTAQPTLEFSTCPTCTDAGLAPRHVELRAFVLTGSNHITVVPGGLTRIALQDRPFAGDPNQSDCTKDTWIVDE